MVGSGPYVMHAMTREAEMIPIEPKDIWGSGVRLATLHIGDLVNGHAGSGIWSTSTLESHAKKKCGVIVDQVYATDMYKTARYVVLWPDGSTGTYRRRSLKKVGG